MRSRILAGFLAAAGLLVMTPAPAQAAFAVAKCSTTNWFSRDHHLYADAYYYIDGANHRWVDIYYYLHGHPTGGKSNLNAWLYANGANVWSYKSPDNREHLVPYGQVIGKTVNASASEYVSFQAIFDVSGPDPKCTAATPRV